MEIFWIYKVFFSDNKVGYQINYEQTAERHASVIDLSIIAEILREKDGFGIIFKPPYDFEKPSKQAPGRRCVQLNEKEIDKLWEMVDEDDIEFQKRIEKEQI